MNDEEFNRDRKTFLAACPIRHRSRIVEALTRLDGFSKAHLGMLTVAPQEQLIQPSVGFNLSSRNSMLWKAYAVKIPKLEVLAHVSRTLTGTEYEVFLTHWRRIPGKAHALQTKGARPMINLVAVADSAVWSRLEACLEWVTALGPV